MPIYAYKCQSCGHNKDVLQKMSDAPLTVCPACGAAAFAKQVTAAGFQLKGSGWYVTDFRGGSDAKSAPATGVPGAAPASSAAASAGETGGAASSESGGSAASAATDSGPSSTSASAPAPASATAASASCGSGCGCH